MNNKIKIIATLFTIMLLTCSLLTYTSQQQTGLSSNQEKLFTCSMCSKAYGKKHHLIRHFDSKHNPDSKQICTICSKEFSDASCLRRHQVAHTTAKPFQCNMCHKKFKRKDNLIRHRTTCKIPLLSSQYQIQPLPNSRQPILPTLQHPLLSNATQPIIPTLNSAPPNTQLELPRFVLLSPLQSQILHYDITLPTILANNNALLQSPLPAVIMIQTLPASNEYLLLHQVGYITPQ